MCVCRLGTSLSLFLENGKWGGKTYRAILGRGGGTSSRVRPPKPVCFRGLRKWDSSGLCPCRLRKMQMTGGKRIIGGGGVSKTVFGLRGFMVCFPLPWVFHPTLFFSDLSRLFKHYPALLERLRLRSPVMEAKHATIMALNESWWKQNTRPIRHLSIYL